MPSYEGNYRNEPLTAPTLNIFLFCFAAACALYEEFWMNYISWLESREESEERTEKLRRAFRRACTSHLPNKVRNRTIGHETNKREGKYRHC